MPDERSRSGRAAPAPGGLIALSRVLPDIASAVPPADRTLVDRVLVAPLLSARDEDLAAVLSNASHGVFDFVIVEGVVLKDTTFASRSALELLGPGDILAPPLSALSQVESRAVSRYVAHGPVSLAVLDARFRQAARHWPGLSDVLHDRLSRQTHRASMHLAMLHQPRVEDRVVALFGDLAERFGRMTGDGVVIDVRLTHEIIGRLVGSRRPTVTLALQGLDSAGVLRRLEGDRWRFTPPPVPPRETA
jgi:CRP/FNR family cyclic AMP-dependent transcriptional regulator